MKAERKALVAIFREIEAKLGVHEYSDPERQVWWEALSRESMFCKGMLVLALKLFFEQDKGRYGGPIKPNLITFQKYCVMAREKRISYNERKRKESEPRREIIGTREIGEKGKRLLGLMKGLLLKQGTPEEKRRWRAEYDEKCKQVMGGE